MDTKLIFVYNADSGLVNGIFDFFHKMMKPSTYKCDLCMITHNYTGMRKAWKSYLETLPFEKDYFHKDEFLLSFPNLPHENVPAIFYSSNGELEKVVTSKELENIDLAELTELLKNKLVSCRLA